MAERSAYEDEFEQDVFILPSLDPNMPGMSGLSTQSDNDDDMAFYLNHARGSSSEKVYPADGTPVEPEPVSLCTTEYDRHTGC